MNILATPVYRGRKSPAALIVAIAAGVDGPDMTTITSVVLVVTNGDRKRNWTTTLSLQTTGSLKATHIYAADGTDVPKPCSLEIMAELYTAGGYAGSAGPFTQQVT